MRQTRKDFAKNGSRGARLKDIWDIRILETTGFTEMLRLTPPAHAGWLGECHVAFDTRGHHLLVHTALGCVMRWNLARINQELRQLGMLPEASPRG